MKIKSLQFSRTDTREKFRPCFIFRNGPVPPKIRGMNPCFLFENGPNIKLKMHPLLPLMHGTFSPYTVDKKGGQGNPGYIGKNKIQGNQVKKKLRRPSKICP